MPMFVVKSINIQISGQIMDLSNKTKMKNKKIWRRSGFDHVEVGTQKINVQLADQYAVPSVKILGFCCRSIADTT